MSWHKKELISYRKKLLTLIFFFFIFGLVLLFWHYGIGQTFKWREIEPVPKPSIFNRLLYSALVYITFGALFYWLKIYQLLYNFFVRFLKDRKIYSGVKGFIWGIFLIVMCFWVVPWTVNLLNSILSLVYNIIGFVLYLCPVLGVSLIMHGVVYILYIKFLQKNENKQ
jgi:hypothetical protein